MAGLRLGVILGHPQLIKWMSCVRLPYSVNAACVYAAGSILAQKDVVYSRAKATMERKEGMISFLKKLDFAIVEGSGNFFLLKVGLNASLFCQVMKDAGILVRNRSQGTGPSDSKLWGMVRVSVGTASENEKFLAAVERFRDSYASIRSVAGFSEIPSAELEN